jgi:hypothetical protein
MPVPPKLDTVGQIFEMRVIGSLYEQVCITTFRYRVTTVTGTGSFPLPAIEAIAQNVWDDGVGLGMHYMTSNQFLSVVFEGQVIAPVRYVVSLDAPTNPTGVVDAAAAAPTVTGVVQKRSEFAGRDKRGRLFIPGVPLTFISGGRLNDTGQTAYGSAIAGFVAPVHVTDTGGTVDLQPVIYNPLAPGNMTDWTEVTFDPILRVQRRREVGRGI